MQANTRRKHDAVRECARANATISETMERAGFPSKDALWVFCKRWGLRDEYAAMRARQDAVAPPMLGPKREAVLPRAGKRVRLPNGITVWRHALAS